MIDKAMSKRSSRLFYYCATIAIAVAGIGHLVITPQHYAHIPAHGLVFALAGIVELAWAVAFWRSPSLFLWRCGVVIAGALIILWGLTQVLGAPFAHEAEPIDAGAIVCKFSEILGMAALTALLFQGLISEPGQSRARVLAGPLALAVVIGIGSFGAGRAAEAIFPSLGPAEAHEPHEEHGAYDLLPL